MGKCIINFWVDARFENGPSLFNFKHLLLNFFRVFELVIPSIFHPILLTLFGWVTVWPRQYQQLSLKTMPFQHFLIFLIILFKNNNNNNK
jgi:hypothetical protein